MFKKSINYVTAICLSLAPLYANTLQESVVEALNTNPGIQEKLKNFRATQQDLHVAESEYYPSIDWNVAVGYNRAGHVKNDSVLDYGNNVRHSDYRNYESSLTLTQNIFNGFSTTNKVDFEEARILAAAYKYLEQSNDVALKMTDAYLEVMKSSALVGTSRQSVEINEGIYNKVQDLFVSGLTSGSEVKKIQSTLALSRSNLTVEINNARDAEYKYKRILGRLPNIAMMQKPQMNIAMPESVERAALYAIDNNPSLLVSKYDIKGAQSLLKQREKGYYPSVDLEYSQILNDNDSVGNGFDQQDDRFRARIVMNYNLYRGGSDKANVQKQISKISQEVDTHRDLQRQVVEGLELSWSAYYMIEKQLQELREYSKYSEETLNLYKEEYDLGLRSLLDLLSAQNDVISSRSQIIEAEYDQLFAKYRILDAMGLLVVTINGTADEFTSKVNLYTDGNTVEILDTLPVSYDVDNDKIADNIDLCDNSLKGDNIMPYGCVKVQVDDDKDGVLNHLDQCPTTPLGVEVQVNGCGLDDDKDGILNHLDKCPKTPLGRVVDANGCELDDDMDGVLNHLDKCLTTPLGTEVNEDGCALDDDRDGVLNHLDQCPTTPVGIDVDENGCELDGDNDGVADGEDSCPNTPEGYSVNFEGCTNLVTLSVNFAEKSSSLPISVDQKVKRFAEFMNDNLDLKAVIVGHTSRTAVSNAAYNLRLSKKRAGRVKNELVRYGVDLTRLSHDGRGFSEPVADNATESGRMKNRRVEIELIREGNI